MKKLLTFFWLLIAANAYGQTAGYLTRSDCAAITSPVEMSVACLQTTTASGRTAGHIYVYRGGAWVDVAGPGGGTDDQTAAEVPFTPNGSIAATDVQAAIQEVRDEATGIPAGADTQVQFNDGGVFAGDAGMTFNKTTNVLTVTGGVTSNLTGNVTGNVTGSSGSTTGNAATATALAANGTNCAAGEIHLGTDASGNAEGCTSAYFTVVTFANLPAAGTVQRFIWVSDCESSTSCDTGGGATYILHYDDGTNWIPIFPSAATPTLQQVGDVGRSLTADCSNPLKILHPSDSTTYWKICHDATDGLVFVPVTGGIENNNNKRVKLIDGKDWCILDNDDVCIFKLTEAGVFSGSAIKKTVEVVPFDFTTDVATGDGKFYFRVPTAIDGYSLSGVQVNVITAGTTNATTVGIDRCAATTSGNVCSGTVTDMLATVFSVDSGENSSSDAATPGALSGTPANLVVTAGQIIRINVDAVSTTAPKGMLVAMDFTAP